MPITSRNAAFLVALLCIILLPASSGAGASADEASLLELISENEDIHINALDLAFFLATHDYDAKPSGDHVVVKLSGRVYRMEPNGEKLGLADVTSSPPLNR